MDQSFLFIVIIGEGSEAIYKLFHLGLNSPKFSPLTITFLILI